METGKGTEDKRDRQRVTETVRERVRVGERA